MRRPMGIASVIERCNTPTQYFNTVFSSGGSPNGQKAAVECSTLGVLMIEEM